MNLVNKILLEAKIFKYLFHVTSKKVYVILNKIKFK